MSRSGPRLACALLLAALFVPACQQRQPQTTWERREDNIAKVIELYADKERQRPERAQATLRRIANHLAGDPENARITARRMLELD